MKTRAQIVVVGAGVAGASIAWHLAQRGCTDVLVIERAEPTSGSTFHSAGLVGQLRSSLPLTQMMMHSVEVYRSLEADAARTGRSPGWREVGSLRIASTEPRMEELRRQHGWAKTFGLPMELVSASEALDLFPLMDATGVLGAVWLPTDGFLDPSGLTHAFLGGARSLGVTVEPGTVVTDLVVRSGRISAVVTDRGTVEADAVVLACGMYTPKVAAYAGITVPIVPMAHQYLITKAIDGVTETLPQLRDPDNLVYFRREGDGLVLGGYERDPAPWSLHGIADDFNNKLLPEDWDRFAPLMTNACRRVPAAETADIVSLVNGPEGFTPDNEFVLGESDVHGLFVAAGFSAHGIAGAGGVGRVMSEWLLDGEPSFDTWKMDIRRFGAQYRSREFACARAVEVYRTYYDIHYPNEEREAGRPLRRSPAYPRLAELGCAFGEKSGWERPNWFEPNGAAATNASRARTPGEAHADATMDSGAAALIRPRGWAGEHWSAAIGAEALACRDTAVLFDETSFSKMELSGPGALPFLERICANRIDRATDPIGAVTYTQLCNERGGVECDLTVTRLATDRFLLVTGTAFGNHDLGWIRKQLDLAPPTAPVHARDVTSTFARFGMWGPRARDVIAPLTGSDLGNAAFPYMRAHEISIGAVPVIALRVTYVGELGWELYCPSEYGLTLWDTLWDAGRAHGMIAGGYRAIDALRLEKGYRVWGADVTPADTPYEAGLGFAVALDKPEPFVGQSELRAAKTAGPARRLRPIVLDDAQAVALGSEPVRIDGEIVGRVTSGGYGYRVERSIAYAYVPAAQAEDGRPVDVEVFGEWIPGEIAREPLYDPTGAADQIVSVLAIDQGTSSTKALVVVENGEVVAASEVSVNPVAGDDGSVEIDPEELWQSVVHAGRGALAQMGARDEPVTAIGFANQGETVLAWDPESAQPLSRALVWQDRRAASVCERLAAEGWGPRLTEISGLELDPYFVAPKLTWLREHVTTAGVAGTSDTWLLRRLTGATVTDAATASRSLLLDLDAGTWSEEACGAFAIDPAVLPRIVDSAGPVGETDAFGPTLPVSGVAVDQQAALFAESCFSAGDVKCTYGTGAFLLANTGPSARRSHNGLVACIAWRLDGTDTYCLDGQVYTVGAAVSWLEAIGLVNEPADLDRVGGSISSAAGAVFVPGLAGLGAPFWAPHAKGAFTGLTLATTRAHLVRAVVEGIAAQVAWLARAAASDLGAPLTRLRVDGGLTRSRTLLQLQADLAQVPVEVYPSPHATALGVAALARLGIGDARSPEAAVGPWAPTEIYEPSIDATAAEEHLAAWREAAEATLGLQGAP